MQTIFVFIQINVMLFVFNLIPVPPLDGSKVMFALMNPRTVWQIRPMLEQYGMFIVLIGVFVFGGVAHQPGHHPGSSDVLVGSKVRQTIRHLRARVTRRSAPPSPNG